MLENQTDEIVESEVDAQTSNADSTETETGDGQTQESNEATGEEANADAESEEQNTAPETYENFDFPEGIEVDEALLADANPVFKEAGLSQEQAQKMVNLQSSYVQAQVDQFTQQVEGWKEETTNDSEYGGDKLKESLGLAKSGFDAYFSPGFMKVLDSSGMSSHPEMIRGLRKIGLTLNEDNPDGGNRSPSSEKSRIEKLYG